MSACPSCLDGVHGNCALWYRMIADAGTCECPCPKMCMKHHPSHRIAQSCGLPLGHEGAHRGCLEWVRDEDLVPWQECLCGYRGTGPHHCDLTDTRLTVTVTHPSGRSVTITPEPRAEYADEPCFDFECQVMDGLRVLKEGTA